MELGFLWIELKTHYPFGKQARHRCSESVTAYSRANSPEYTLYIYARYSFHAIGPQSAPRSSQVRCTIKCCETVEGSL